MDNLPNELSHTGSTPEDKSSTQGRTVYDLWGKRGEDDITYQRQAQVTWWTLLGGIAMAALLTQFESLLNEFREGNWFYIFYLFATCFVIINSWIQTAWGALVLRWPISVLTSIYLFFGGLASSIAALSITNPPMWYAATGFVVLFAVLMQLNFMKHHGWIAMPPDAVKRVKQGIVVYMILIGITFVLSILLCFYPFVWVKIAGGALGLILSIAALFWQHLGMNVEKNQMGIA